MPQAPSTQRTTRLLIGGLLTVACGLLLGLALAIGLGGPKPAAPMPSINEPFKGLDMSDLPPPLTYRASDGADLAYRVYPVQTAKQNPAQGSVVLVHGSSASGASMHRMAKAFQAAGLTVYVPDIRGHGASGPKGDIDHIGQLEEDMLALLAAIKPTGSTTLVGFSAGGGFALRFAAGPHAARFQHYLLLSPFLGPHVPTFRPDAGWVQVGIPRIVGLGLLNAVGITAWNHLPVVNYALNPQAQAVLTPSYSYSLLQNFGPPEALNAAIGRVKQPCAILAGADDELFHVDQFEPLVRAAGANWPVRIIPQTSHITLVLNLEAIAAAVDQVRTWSR
jgi:non-heme chloroperoxidase